MTKEELQKEFQEETGISIKEKYWNALNSYCEWLENKLLQQQTKLNKEQYFDEVLHILLHTSEVRDAAKKVCSLLHNNDELIIEFTKYIHSKKVEFYDGFGEGGIQICRIPNENGEFDLKTPAQLAQSFIELKNRK